VTPEECSKQKGLEILYTVQLVLLFVGEFSAAHRLSKREISHFLFVSHMYYAYMHFVPDLSRLTNVGITRRLNIMKYTPQHIANFILERGEQDKVEISPMKLLKLVYISYGWVLALTDKKLFEEDIQAWKHGPVIPSIYHEFKHFGKLPITERALVVDLDAETVTCPTVSRDDRDTNLILGKVWSVYKDFSGWSLRNKTHEEGTPWKDVYKPGEFETVIPDDKIKSHYKERIKTYLDAAA
jgi:uncharacterized phage-associated protein